MIENVSTQLTVFHCLCPLPASRKGLRLTLRSALFGEGGRDWRPCLCSQVIYSAHRVTEKNIWMEFNENRPKCSEDIERTRNSRVYPLTLTSDIVLEPR